jgi:hypothetical protein
MTAHQGLDALIGFAVALLLASLLALAALAKERPKDKRRQLEAAYRQFSPSVDLPGRKRGPRLNILLAVLVILNVVWLGFFAVPSSGGADGRIRRSSERGFRRSAVERGSVVSHRDEEWFAGGADHSGGEGGRLRQALPIRSNSRYVPWWGKHRTAGAALGGRQVGVLPATHEDRPVGSVHHTCRVGPPRYLSASRARPGLRRGVKNLCASDHGLTFLVISR